MVLFDLESVDSLDVRPFVDQPKPFLETKPLSNFRIQFISTPLQEAETQVQDLLPTT